MAPSLGTNREVEEAELRGLSALDAWLNLGDAAPRYFQEER